MAIKISRKSAKLLSGPLKSDYTYHLSRLIKLFVQLVSDYG